MSKQEGKKAADNASVSASAAGHPPKHEGKKGEDGASSAGHHTAKHDGRKGDDNASVAGHHPPKHDGKKADNLSVAGHPSKHEVKKADDSASTATAGHQHHTPDSRRDGFRRYLEKTGVLDALTRVLVGLYEEPQKPENPIEYFLERLVTGVPIVEEQQNVILQLQALQEKLKEVEEDNVRLRASLERYETIVPIGETEGEGFMSLPDAGAEGFTGVPEGL